MWFGSFWFSQGGGGGGAIELQNDGVLVLADTRVLNIQSSTHDAILVNPTTVMITDVAFPSHFNNNDGVGDRRLSQFATTNRHISDPAPENNFAIGGWSPGDVRQASNTSNWVYDTGGVCLFDDLTTTIEVWIYDETGAQVRNHAQVNVSGNIDVTLNNIRIQVTSWGTIASKYQGRVIITAQIGTVFPNGNRCSVRCSHTGGVIFNETDKFYDPNSVGVSINTNPTIAENTISSSKYLSGVRYYDEGDTFDLSITDIDGANIESYPNTDFLEVDASDYGIASYDVDELSFAGWTNYWNNQNASYAATRAINVDEYRFIGTDANLVARIDDWASPADTASSANALILVDTCEDPPGTDLAEYFTSEAYRRLAGYTGAEGLWDSTQDIGAYDGNTGAQVIGGILKVGDTDFSTYNPAGNPNYSAHAAPKDFYRRFTDVTSGERTSAYLALSGANFNLTNLINGNVQIWIFVPGRMSGSPCFVHGAAEYNPGSFDGDNDPMRLSDSTETNIHISFGSNWGLLGANNYFIMRIVITNSIVQPSGIVVSW